METRRRKRIGTNINQNKCPKCSEGYIYCSGLKDDKWLEQCTNCDYSVIHKDRRKKERRRFQRSDNTDRRKS